MRFATSLRAGGPRAGTAHVLVDFHRVTRVVPSQPVGVNTAAWDGSLMDKVIPERLKNAGANLLRFPGGSTSDAYNWKTNEIVPGQSGGTDPSSSFDRFIRLVVKPAHAQAIITVNYGSNFSGKGGGSPAQAAAWVKHAGELDPKAVAYWEIGNEVYGNGYYGASWETDLHKSHSPATYGENAVKFIKAMKAVNSKIKVGVVVTAPGNWPDGQGPELWNKTVLEHTCDAAAFVSVHWYAQNPGQENDARLLGAPYGSTPSSSYRLSKMLNTLRSELHSYCGRRGATMPILMTETNSVSSNPGKQSTSIVNALFLVEDYLESLASGAKNVTWWTLHNGPVTSGNNSTSLYGNLNYGDYGLLTNGQSPESSTNQPLPTYKALELVHDGLKPKGEFLKVHSSSGIHAYGLRMGGKLNIFLINPSSTRAQNVSTMVKGVKTLSAAKAVQLGASPSNIHSVAVHMQGDTLHSTLPHYTAQLITVDTSGSR